MTPKFNPLGLIMLYIYMCQFHLIYVTWNPHISFNMYFFTKICDGIPTFRFHFKPMSYHVTLVINPHYTHYNPPFITCVLPL